MNTVWILVAGEIRARILEKVSDACLEEIAEFKNNIRIAQPKGATPEMLDLLLHQQSQMFAELVAERLEDEWLSGRFKELVIIAAPRMVGYLRPEMAPSLKSATVLTLYEDLVDESISALSQRIPSLSVAN